MMRTKADKIPKRPAKPKKRVICFLEGAPLLRTLNKLKFIYSSAGSMMPDEFALFRIARSV
jgi:hypothetical protein